MEYVLSFLFLSYTKQNELRLIGWLYKAYIGVKARYLNKIKRD